MTEQNNTEQAYNKWSRTYDSCENPTRDLDYNVIREVLKDISEMDIIEAGCGTGKNSVWFAANAKSLRSFDFSNEMLVVAKKKMIASNAEFQLHNITNTWPFPDESCDIVSINLVLEHIKNIHIVIEHAYRVLRKDGRLFICELHPEKQKNGSKAKFHDHASNSQIEIVSHYHSKKEYTDAAIKAGFQNIELNDWYDEINKDIPRLLSVLLQK